MSITTLQGRDVAAQRRADGLIVPPAALLPPFVRPGDDASKRPLALPRLPEGISFFADVFPFIAALLLIVGFVLMAVPMFAHHAAGFMGGSVLAGH
ncbi:hypothetical protein [Acidiphilium sp.]|uniref:hypothetical protein n=1 Tax=Acidiphilium sp. TaxID=527 RepID=UPI003D07CC1A